MGQTLRHVPNLLWIVIEDANETTALVTRQLERVGVQFVHLTCTSKYVSVIYYTIYQSLRCVWLCIAALPDGYKQLETSPRSSKNRGLAWLRANATEGVLYFADDDNTYDLELFQQVERHIYIGIVL